MPGRARTPRRAAAPEEATVRLGLWTTVFGDVRLPEVIRWAGAAGFDALAIPAPPVRRPESWFRGCALAVGGLDGPGRDAFSAALEEAGLVAVSLASGVSVLDPDPDRAARACGHLEAVVQAAGALGVGVVTVAVRRRGAEPPGDAIAALARVLGPVLATAEAVGVRLAVDTDPWPGEAPADLPSGAAFCPELWEKLFTHIRSDAVGLLLDPGALLWQGIDPVVALTDYAEKVFHVRARDVEVEPLRRQDCGVLRPAGGWWRYRLPGLGEVDWRRLLDRARQLGLADAVAIDHADPTFRDGLDEVKAGLALARRLLVQYLP